MTGGTRRLALVLVPPGAVVGNPPPGIDREPWSRALIEDSYEVLADLARTAAGLAGDRADLAALADLTWPDTVLVALDPDPAGPALLLAVDAVGDRADAVLLLSPDAPDLPGLHVAKVFQALEHADLAWVPVADGGVAALGFALPVPAWVRELGPTFDGDPTIWVAAAPARRLAVAVPGWHRLRAAGDLRHLDPGLSGWENTRALLAGAPLS